MIPPRGVALQIKYKSNNFEKTLVAVEHAMFVSDDLNIDTCSDLSTIPSKQLTTNNNNNNNEKLQHSKMHTIKAILYNSMTAFLHCYCDNDNNNNNNYKPRPSHMDVHQFKISVCSCLFLNAASVRCTLQSRQCYVTPAPLVSCKNRIYQNETGT